MTAEIELSTTVHDVVTLHRNAEAAGANAFEQRAAVGKRLREIRKTWPKSGPGSSSWVKFLDVCGIPKTTANRYVREYEEQAGIRTKVVRTEKPQPAFDVTAASIDLRKRVARALDAWPVESLGAAADVLRDIATELQSKGYVNGHGKRYGEAVVNAVAVLEMKATAIPAAAAAPALPPPEVNEPEPEDDAIEDVDERNGEQSEQAPTGETMKCIETDCEARIPFVAGERNGSRKDNVCTECWAKRKPCKTPKGETIPSCPHVHPACSVCSKYKSGVVCDRVRARPATVVATDDTVPLLDDLLDDVVDVDETPLESAVDDPFDGRPLTEIFSKEKAS